MTTYAARPAVADGDALIPTTGTGVDRPVVLDAWAARSCPVKTQHRFDPRQTPPVPVPAAADDPLVLRAEAARRHEAVVLERFIARGTGRVADLRLLAADGPDVQAAATRPTTRSWWSGTRS